MFQFERERDHPGLEILATGTQSRVSRLTFHFQMSFYLRFLCLSLGELCPFPVSNCVDPSDAKFQFRDLRE